MNRWHRQEIFTEEEAADFLHVSQRQVRQLVQEGKLAVVRDGPRYTRFLWSDLMDYLWQHRRAPLPRAQDMAALRAHRRQTEGWRNVYRALMAEGDRRLSITSTLRTYFPEDEAQALVTVLRDLEWPELVQASRTLVDHLSVLEEKGTLTALVRACEALVRQLSGTPGSTRDAAELGLSLPGQAARARNSGKRYGRNHLPGQIPSPPAAMPPGGGALERGTCMYPMRPHLDIGGAPRSPGRAGSKRELRAHYSKMRC